MIPPDWGVAATAGQRTRHCSGVCTVHGLLRQKEDRSNERGSARASRPIRLILGSPPSGARGVLFNDIAFRSCIPEPGREEGLRMSPVSAITDQGSQDSAARFSDPHYPRDETPCATRASREPELVSPTGPGEGSIQPPLAWGPHSLLRRAASSLSVSATKKLSITSSTCSGECCSASTSRYAPYPLLTLQRCCIALKIVHACSR